MTLRNTLLHFSRHGSFAKSQEGAGGRIGLLNLAGAIALTTLLLAACNSDPDTGLYARAPVSAPRLPVIAAFTTTSTITPAASTGATSLTVPLPASTGYAGQALFPVASVPPNLHLTISYTNRPPAGVSAFSAVRQPAGAQRTTLNALSTDVVYACFAANYLVTLNEAPQFSFVLPLGFATNSVVYDLAIAQGARWTAGYGGPGTVVAGTGAATVSVAGRFGFTIPANGTVCVALYGRSTSAPMPVPATPAPTASPSPVPSATATATASASSTPTATPSPAASSTPAPSPTPSAALAISPGTLSLLGLGASFAQSASVQETNYTQTFTITATSCASIASVSPSTGSGPTLTLTISGLAVGTCTATATDGSGQTAQLQISVTTSGIGVSAKQRKP
jgi:hypothetical protein